MNGRTYDVSFFANVTVAGTDADFYDRGHVDASAGAG